MEHGAFLQSGEIHYHICWSDSSLDWKAFATEEEARKTAEQMTQRHESYTIIGRDGDCERCKAFKARADE